ADTQTQAQAEDIAHPERHDHSGHHDYPGRHDHSGAHAGVEDLDDEPCAVCGMDRPYHEAECPEHLRERALETGLSEDEMDEVLTSDSDLPGHDLDGRFWWDSDYSDHDPGTSSPGDEPCAVCGMERPDHEAGCPERLRRYGRGGRGRGGIAIS
ncbi:MAG: hypothetical protein OXH20_00240, partial [bacterium]|nr:hypothetical protein [bacterium]